MVATGFHCCWLTKHSVAAAFGFRLWAPPDEKEEEITKWDGKRGREQARKEKYEKQKRNAMDMSHDKLKALWQLVVFTHRSSALQSVHRAITFRVWFEQALSILLLSHQITWNGVGRVVLRLAKVSSPKQAHLLSFHHHPLVSPFSCDCEVFFQPQEEIQIPEKAVLVGNQGKSCYIVINRCFVAKTFSHT